VGLTPSRSGLYGPLRVSIKNIAMKTWIPGGGHWETFKKASRSARNARRVSVRTPGVKNPSTVNVVRPIAYQKALKVNYRGKTAYLRMSPVGVWFRNWWRSLPDNGKAFVLGLVFVAGVVVSGSLQVMR